MRRTMLTLLLAIAPAAAAAPQAPTAEPPALPRDVRRMAIDRFNGANEFRAVDRADISEKSEVHGNVSVLRGPLTIEGRVAGSVLMINGDVILRPTARIEGDLIVVGGEIDGINTARIDGSIRIYRQTLAYRQENDRIVALNDNGTADENWWQRLEHRREGNWSEALRIVQAGAYNRVEGLPIQLGPAIQRRTPWGSIRFDAAGIVRTGMFESNTRSDVGHLLATEVRVGQDHAVGVGGRIFNTIDPIEAWQLSDLEAALAAFLVRRDYRDYYQRHGGDGSLTLYGARNLSLTGSFGAERWSSRTLNNPFSLFNAERDWRPNPAVDEGLFHVGDLALKFDTRTDPTDPWSGWFLNADLEHGSGIIDQPGIRFGDLAGDRAGKSEYSRGFFDFRRYNRLGPSAQLNLRLVLGGWVGGDPLPIQKRYSVDGPGALPGFGFRSEHTGIDVGNCNIAMIVPGVPALCDRIALAQMEYRGDLKVDFTGDWQDWLRGHRSGHGDVSWVVFADAGRGWRVGTPSGDLTYGSTTLPSLSTFRTDIGVGLDVAGLGIYSAKALSSMSEPPNFFLRLRHRF